MYMINMGLKCLNLCILGIFFYVFVVAIFVGILTFMSRINFVLS